MEKESLSIGQVLDKVKHIGARETAKCLIQSSCEDSGSYMSSIDTVHKSLCRLAKKHLKLKKSSGSVETFLQTPYKFPRKQAFKTSASSARSDSITLLDHREQSRVLYDVSQSLASENNSLRKKQTKIIEYMKVVEREKEKTEKEKEQLLNRGETLNLCLKSTKSDLKRTLSRESYWREKAAKLDNAAHGNETTKDARIRELVDELERTQSVLETETENVDYLQQELESKNEN